MNSLEGGTAINYEIRYMLMLLASIINQKPVQLLRRHINWEKILKISDYQNVINIVYLGILGIEKVISEECETQFYQSYRRVLLLRGEYKNAEEVIMWQLEKHGIDALFLSDTTIEKRYPKPEMAYIGQIEILVENKNLPQIHRLMREMDYEQKEDRIGNGILYERVPGIRIVFYSELPVKNKNFRQWFLTPVKKYRHIGDYKFIHTLSREEEYLYRIGKMVEQYLAGALKVREIVDFRQYKESLNEEFRQKEVKDILTKLKWQEFAGQMNVLCELWFGEGVRQEYGLALELEEFILLRRQENTRLDKTLLPEEKVRLDFYLRNREEEWAAKKREWAFPPREYMQQFFPVLEKYHFLLLLCWMIRGLRFLKQICLRKWRQAWIRISVRFLDLKEKLKKAPLEDGSDEGEPPKEEFSESALNAEILETEGDGSVEEFENQE